jgi:hypothetical protein
MKTNTKNNFLKLAMTLMAIFIFSGAMAQTPIPGQANAVYAAEGTVYMVEGTTIPVYALPDPVYHASWDYATANWTLTAGFVWNWSVTGGTALNVTFGSAAANYVEVSVSTAGTYEIQVTEEAPVAFGGCVGTGTVLAIEVVATPAATMGVLDGTTPSFCASDLSIPTSVPVTISGGWQNYRLAWSLEIATLDGSSTKDEWFDTDKITSLGAALDYAEEYTEAIPEAVAAAGAHDIISVGSFTVINNKPTVYTYSLTSINDQALRFGDFLALNGDASIASAFTYNAINETYSIQVNPAPVTGPIYHIPSTWGQ